MLHCADERLRTGRGRRCAAAGGRGQRRNRGVRGRGAGRQEARREPGRRCQEPREGAHRQRSQRRRAAGQAAGRMRMIGESAAGNCRTESGWRVLLPSVSVAARPDPAFDSGSPSEGDVLDTLSDTSAFFLQTYKHCWSSDRPCCTIRICAASQISFSISKTRHASHSDNIHIFCKFGMFYSPIKARPPNLAIMLSYASFNLIDEAAFTPGKLDVSELSAV